MDRLLRSAQALQFLRDLVTVLRPCRSAPVVAAGARCCCPRRVEFTCDSLRSLAKTGVTPLFLWPSRAVLARLLL